MYLIVLLEGPVSDLLTKGLKAHNLYTHYYGKSITKSLTQVKKNILN